MRCSSNSKWIVYFLTLTTYATFHSIRSAWAMLKPMLSKPPFDYQEQFLGLLDMIVVFTLAVGLSTVGHRVDKIGPKKCLLFGMALLLTFTATIGLLLIFQVTSKAIYLILFGLGVGGISIVGWPSCLCILSKRFNSKDNSTALPLWNGTSQLGDFLALFIGIFVIRGLTSNGGFCLIMISAIMVCLWILDTKFLPKDSDTGSQGQNSGRNTKQKDVIELNEELENQNQNDQGFPKEDIVNDQRVESEQSKEPEISDINSNQESYEESTEEKPVTFITVWCLPSVALYVCAYSFIKAINSIVMAWLVFDLSNNGLDSESRLITIVWTLGVFFGGVIGGRINPNYKKSIFIVSLLISGLTFVGLQKMFQKQYEVEIILLVLVSSLSYGGPYNMMSTAVPIMLGEKKQIRKRKGAKSAIIALMEGFGQFVCGLSILLVPSIGVEFMHWIQFCYCMIGIAILTVAIFSEARDRDHSLKSKKDEGTNREIQLQR